MLDSIAFAPATKPAVKASTVEALLDEAPTSRFHRRAVIISGVGFFTDAYDLFVISTVATLVSTQWRLSTTQTSWVSGAAVLGAFVGAFAFGRLADLIGRKKVYVAVAVVMVVGAIASAVAPSFGWLVATRLVLGIGIGGDYPVSAVMMSEYSNRSDRGRLVGLVFSMQAAGLIVGPLVALGLLASGLGHEMTWRLLLGLGAVPAGAVIYLRSKMPESPRYTARVAGRSEQAARQAVAFSRGELSADGLLASDASGGPATDRAAARGRDRSVGLGAFLRNPRMLLLLIGTSGAWFLFDYAYYGNTLSLPVILKGLDGHASIEAKLAWTLGIFVVFAVPGYLLGVLRMDKIGHRYLQLLGFAVMAAAFLVLGAVPQLTTPCCPSWRYSASATSSSSSVRT